MPGMPEVVRFSSFYSQNTPQQINLNSLKTCLSLIFSGMCMGAADLVPGISGGTVAFIIGIYEPLLQSLKSINLNALKLLFSFRFKDFFNAIHWQFLFLLLFGIGVSILSFAQLFSYFLNHEVLRTYLFSGFFGLILASIFFCTRQIKRWNQKYIVAMIIGTVLAFSFTVTFPQLLKNKTKNNIQTENSEKMLKQNTIKNSQFNLWIITCGALAICALLLPGISGSYLLTILGMYGVVLRALNDFTQGLSQAVFNVEAFLILLNLGIGIIIGGLLFSHVVSWLLRNYHNVTIATMTGFMIGAFPSVWPFWNYISTTSKKGTLLEPTFPYWPEFGESYFFIALFFMAIGFASVFSIEWLANKKKKIYIAVN